MGETASRLSNRGSCNDCRRCSALDPPPQATARQVERLCLGLNTLSCRKLYSRLGGEQFPREAAQECEKFIHEVLNELAKLPECAEPDWEEQLEEEEA